MIWLVQLLLKEKWRRVQARYGTAGAAGFGVILAVMAAGAAVAAARLLARTPQEPVCSLMNYVWLGWVGIGVCTGMDLTWRIRLDRLKVFPVAGFPRLYSVGYLLSFASFPLSLLLAVFQTAGSVRTPSLPAAIAVLAAFCLFLASVKCAVSFLRAVIHRGWALSRSVRLFAFFVVISLAAVATACLLRPGFEGLLPGGPTGLILAGAEFPRSLSRLAGFVVFLTTADFVVQRSATYSGLAGPPACGGQAVANGRLLSIHCSWPAPLWRVSLLGWLRNRNAVLLLAWGSLYGFFFMYLTGPHQALDFFLFSTMALIFHAYLRGNLLGVDHKGAWLYYMFPAPVGGSLQAKNQTLSTLQGVMVAAVLLPAGLQRVPSMDGAAWLSVASYAYSNILVGEISGSVFSLRRPEPIERGSQFAGGATAGALIIPFLQLLFLAFFMASTGLARILSPAAFWGELIVVPAALRFVRCALLPGWIETTMVNQRRAILSKLSVFSS